MVHKLKSDAQTTNDKVHCQSSLSWTDRTCRRLAVRSLISLCLIDGKPSLGQDSACSTEKWVPQSQLIGVRAGI